MFNEQEKELLKKYNETEQDLLEDIYCDEFSFLNCLIKSLDKENNNVAKSLINKINKIINKGIIKEYRKENKTYYKIANKSDIL